MEKLNKVIAGLECCTERRCTSCPYLEQEMYCMTVLEKDALEVVLNLRTRLNDAKNGRLELARQYRDLEEKLSQTKIELSYERGRAEDYGRKVTLARAERDEARRKVLRLEAELFKLRQTPNDWGEYPPEFPREGM